MLANLNTHGRYILGGLSNFGKFRVFDDYLSFEGPENLPEKSDEAEEKMLLDFILEDASLMAQRQSAGKDSNPVHKKDYERT